MNAYSREMVQRGFPGLSPRPSLDGTRVTWAERFVDPNGHKAKRIQVYDLETSQLQTVAETSDITRTDLWSPTISGSMVGWLEQQPSGSANQILRSLTDGTLRSFSLPESPRSSAVLDGGRFLALALENGMVVFDLKSGSSTKVTDSGTWMYTNGHDISWAAVSGHVGYYDPMAREVHLIDTRGAETVDAYVMGSYFVWQEFRTSSADATQVGPRTSAFYALRLGE